MLVEVSMQSITRRELLPRLWLVCLSEIMLICEVLPVTTHRQELEHCLWLWHTRLARIDALFSARTYPRSRAKCSASTLSSTICRHHCLMLYRVTHCWSLRIKRQTVHCASLTLSSLTLRLSWISRSIVILWHLTVSVFGQECLMLLQRLIPISQRWQFTPALSSMCLTH